MVGINKVVIIIAASIIGLFLPPLMAQTPTQTNTCTKIVSKYNKNASESTFRSLRKALNKYESGDIICLSDSYQSAIKIEDFDAGDQPLTIRPQHYLGSIIKSRHYIGTGITVKNSRGIIIEGLIITGGLSAILIQDSSNISLIANRVFNTGNQAISIKPRHHGGSHYLIKDNVIFNTGMLNPRYGEGIYIGDGSYTEDRSRLRIRHTVSDVTIANNTIQHTGNEAIDVKANAYDVNIVNNTITDISLKFNAAITIATESSYAPLGGYTVEGNVITNITNRSGYRPIAIAIGHGDTLIKDNIIVDEAKNFVAICLFTTFLNPKLNNVALEHNMLIGSGTPFSANCTGGTKDKAKAVVTVK